ncbi:MAG: hypothetical protein OEV00_00010 [Acidobacteriota bacterium]|nr:hypothetical protein [Acidobacteriota bacterium]MDH3783687.1 hypothetical protein [Acidobacteriota bacterium]
MTIYIDGAFSSSPDHAGATRPKRHLKFRARLAARARRGGNGAVISAEV